MLVLDKEQGVGRHQTGHNSGVAHAGIYYPPGSLKADLCARGRAMLGDFCAEHGIAFEECGKVVVAVDAAELPRLAELERRATTNAVPGLRRLGPQELLEVEPHAAGLSALHSPRTAITDFAAVAAALADDVRRAGGEVLLGREVTGLRSTGRGVAVQREGDLEPLSVDAVVLCAGLQADRVARLCGGPPQPRIVPFRGEYLTVLPAKQDLVRGLIYPVPDPRYPFLGVHYTRRVGGTLDVGPNAVLALARESYRRTGLDAADVREIITWPGTWRMAGRHWRTGARELLGSLSVAAYLRAAARYVPAIGPGDVVRGPVGVRAQAVDRDGTLVDDFRIERHDRITAVRNAPSPAATSSLAIAERIATALGW